MGAVLPSDAGSKDPYVKYFSFDWRRNWLAIQMHDADYVAGRK